MAGLAPAWAMASRRPNEYRRKVDAAARYSVVRPHTRPDLIFCIRIQTEQVDTVRFIVANICIYRLRREHLDLSMHVFHRDEA